MKTFFGDVISIHIGTMPVLLLHKHGIVVGIGVVFVEWLFFTMCFISLTYFPSRFESKCI